MKPILPGPTIAELCKPLSAKSPKPVDEDGRKRDISQKRTHASSIGNTARHGKAGAKEKSK
jgi:hypothetical protein